MNEGKRSKDTPEMTSETPAREDFLIIGIGASAGGIQALKTFFENVPADSGMAYVVILHLSPDHDSQLAEVLQTVSPIPVEKVTKKTRVEPNCVYVVPPNKHLEMAGEYITVSPNISVEERRAPVDIFFRTLAESHKSRAIAVILSGTGANGSMGIKRIKERGGAAFVQNPREAEYSDMPRNSIATDLIDAVLNVSEIPARILSYKESLGKIEIPIEAEQRPADVQQALREIFTQIRLRTGHDFSNYKRPTILRRIERRVNIHGLHDLPSYAAFLRDNGNETHALLKDLLISVTNFFRDKDSFNHLENEVLPKIFQGKTSGEQVRIWVAGCATGEEAYTIAMLCAERTVGLIDAPEVQIFASDIDDNAISQAREGFYTLNDAADVSPERLRRFFVKEADGFRIRRELREMILFANHNVIKDPPFSHLDLVSCRNLLIYLNHSAQERVMETFHFALNPGGFLFLGNSESSDGASDLYATVDKQNRIYQSRQASARIVYPIPDTSSRSFRFEQLQQPQQQSQTTLTKAENNHLERISLGNLHQQLLEQYAPPSLIVNEHFDIVHLSERAGKYLQIAGGEPTPNLLKLIRPELRLEVRTALYQAVQNQTNVEVKNLKVRTELETEIVNIYARPVLQKSGDTARGFVLVVFEQSDENAEVSETVYTSAEPIARQLEEELLRTKSQLRRTSEQFEVQAEELKASNEELQAINEELRTAAEELETSKEELQSVNEELITVNQELKIKIDELSISNNDFQNLINSTDIATIFLDRSFKVHTFTPAANRIFNLLPADYGRPLSDITNNLTEDHLTEIAATVLETLQSQEREMRSDNGRVYLMRVLPYRTAEDRIGGVVLTFTDITERKQAEEIVRESEEKYRHIFNSIDEGFCVVEMIFDAENKLIDYLFLEVNPVFEQMTGLENAVGKTVYQLIPNLELFWVETFGRVALTGESERFENYSAPLNRQFDVHASRVGGQTSRKVVIVFNDITERKRRETNLAFLAEVSKDLVQLTNIDETMSSLCAKIGEHFKVARVVFAEIGEDETTSVIRHEWRLDGLPTLKEAVELKNLLVSKLEAAQRDGDISYIRDVTAELRDAALTLTTLGIASLLGAPLVRDEKLHLYLGILHSEPREWRRDEIELMRELTNRIGTHLERTRVEESLKESEARYDLATQAVKAVIYDWDILTNRVERSPELLNLLDFDPNDETTRTNQWFCSRVHPEDAKRTEELVQISLKSGDERFDFEFRLRHRDGFYVWVNDIGIILRDENGKAVRCVGSVTNITTRKEAEETLRQSEERLRLLIESTEDYAIFTMTTDGIIDSWNIGAEKTFGWTETEAVGQSCKIIFTPEDRKKGAPELEMKTALKKGRAPDERFHLRKDGSRFYVSGVMTLLKDADGKASGLVKIARDMSLQKKADKIMHDKEMLQKLVGAQEDERRRIARDLHDELGQQLTALRLNLERARKICQDEEVCAEIDKIELLAKSIDNGVDFLAWELRPAALDQFGLVAALANYVEQWTHYSGVSADFLSSRLKRKRFAPEVETNLYRIAQEAMNNINKHAKAKTVEVMLEKRGDLLVLIIQDDGIGFNVADKKTRGTGIGLIGMQERVELIKGTLEIESAVGGGTTVFVRVPV